MLAKLGIIYTWLTCYSERCFYDFLINGPCPPRKWTQHGDFLTARQYLYRRENGPSPGCIQHLMLGIRGYPSFVSHGEPCLLLPQWPSELYKYSHHISDSTSPTQCHQFSGTTILVHVVRNIIYRNTATHTVRLNAGWVLICTRVS